MSQKSTSPINNAAQLTPFKQQLQAIFKANSVNLPEGSNEILDQTEHILANSDILITSLNVGAYVNDFELNSQWCNAKSLYELLDTGPVVLSFYRGIWCSYCRAEIAEYDQLMNQLLTIHPAYPIHYLAITPQQVFDQGVDSRRYHLILDKQLKIARQFGLVYELPKAEQELFTRLGLSLPQVNKTGRWELPIPGVYIVNQNRQVEFCHLSVDYRDRADPNEVIAHF